MCCTIYIAIMRSLGSEEAGHKLEDHAAAGTGGVRYMSCGVGVRGGGGAGNAVNHVVCAVRVMCGFSVLAWKSFRQGSELAGC